MRTYECHFLCNFAAYLENLPRIPSEDPKNKGCKGGTLGD